MNIASTLEKIRRDFPACETLAYADISTNNVLSSSAETTLRQEHLNDLCNTAVDMLTGPSAAQVARVWEEGQTASPDVYQAIIVEAAEVGIFLRSASNPTDALCCVCQPSIDIPAFIATARQRLEEIGEDK